MRVMDARATGFAKFLMVTQARVVGLSRLLWVPVCLLLFAAHVQAQDSRVMAQYVMVHQNGTEQPVYVSEVDVMSDGVDVADTHNNASAQVTMHRHNVHNHPNWGGGQMLVDSYTGVVIVANGWSTDVPPATDRWFEIDLGQPYPIDSIEVHAISNGRDHPQYANNLTVFVSASSMIDANNTATGAIDYNTLRAGTGPAAGVVTV